MEPTYDFIKPDHGSTLVSAVGNVYHSKEFTDVTIICRDYIRIEAHKLVLSAHSQYFKDFFKNYQESGRDLPCVVVLPHLNPVVLRKVIDYMYTGKLSIPRSSLAKLIQAGSFLKMDDFQGLPSTSRVSSPAVGNPSSAYPTNEDRQGDQEGHSVTDGEEGLAERQHGMGDGTKEVPPSPQGSSSSSSKSSFETVIRASPKEPLGTPSPQLDAASPMLQDSQEEDENGTEDDEVQEREEDEVQQEGDINNNEILEADEGSQSGEETAIEYEEQADTIGTPTHDGQQDSPGGDSLEKNDEEEESDQERQESNSDEESDQAGEEEESGCYCRENNAFSSDIEDPEFNEEEFGMESTALLEPAEGHADIEGVFEDSVVEGGQSYDTEDEEVAYQASADTKVQQADKGSNNGEVAEDANIDEFEEENISGVAEGECSGTDADEESSDSESGSEAGSLDTDEGTLNEDVDETNIDEGVVVDEEINESEDESNDRELEEVNKPGNDLEGDDTVDHGKEDMHNVIDDEEESNDTASDEGEADNSGSDADMEANTLEPIEEEEEANFEGSNDESSSSDSDEEQVTEINDDEATSSASDAEEDNPRDLDVEEANPGNSDAEEANPGELEAEEANPGESDAELIYPVESEAEEGNSGELDADEDEEVQHEEEQEDSNAHEVEEETEGENTNLGESYVEEKEVHRDEAEFEEKEEEKEADSGQIIDNYASPQQHVEVEITAVKLGKRVPKSRKVQSESSDSSGSDSSGNDSSGSDSSGSDSDSSSDSSDESTSESSDSSSDSEKGQSRRKAQRKKAAGIKQGGKTPSKVLVGSKKVYRQDKHPEDKGTPAAVENNQKPREEVKVAVKKPAGNNRRSCRSPRGNLLSLQKPVIPGFGQTKRSIQLIEGGPSPPPPPRRARIVRVATPIPSRNRATGPTDFSSAGPGKRAKLSRPRRMNMLEPGPSSQMRQAETEQMVVEVDMGMQDATGYQTYNYPQNPGLYYNGAYIPQQQGYSQGSMFGMPATNFYQQATGFGIQQYALPEQQEQVQEPEQIQEPEPEPMEVEEADPDEPVVPRNIPPNILSTGPLEKVGIYSCWKGKNIENAKTYFCDVCLHITSWKRDGMRHELKHTGERPFCCEHCDATYKRREHLKRHFKAQHPEKFNDGEFSARMRSIDEENLRNNPKPTVAPTNKKGGKRKK